MANCFSWRDEMGFSPLEILGLVHGVKPISRMSVNPKEASFGTRFKKFREKCERLGLQWQLEYFENFAGAWPDTTMLYVCKRMKTIEELIEAEKARDVKKIGRIFGFPECCIEFFFGKAENRSNIAFEVLKNSKKPLSFYNNFVLYTASDFKPKNALECNCLKEARNKSFYFIYHIPCSFNCNKSIEMGKKYKRVLEKEAPLLAEQAKNALKKTMVYFGSFNFVLLNDAIEGKSENEAFYESVFEFPTTTSKKILEKIRQGNRIKAENGALAVFKNRQKILELKK
ncbi:MAG: hypothetical protein QXK06_04865 [Candidatus Diapherotrites archaeon]